MNKKVVGLGNAGMLIAMASALSGQSPWEHLPPPPVTLDLNDLKAEYDLIQKKQSKLSANQRRYVVAKYERLQRNSAGRGE